MNSFQGQIDLPLVVSTLSAHQYEYKESIGKGGFATVHLVRSQKYNQDFCVKLIPMKDISKSASEIDTLMQLSSPLIIKVYEHFFYIVLEYCSGGSLLEYDNENGPLQKDRLYQTCSALLNALKHCHDNKIAHRDIKPANVLIDMWGRPKLADFGLSRIYNNEALASNYAGSKTFIAPEIINRTAYNPFQADIWALGITFFYFAYGKVPWESKNHKEVELQIKMGLVVQPRHPTYDASFANSITMMCQVKPSKRATLSWLLDQECFKNPSLMSKIPKAQSIKEPKLNYSFFDSDPSARMSVPHRSLKIFDSSDNNDKTPIRATVSHGLSIKQATSGNIPVYAQSRSSTKYLIKCITPQPMLSNGAKPCTLSVLPRL